MEKEILQQISKQVSSHTKAVASLATTVNKIAIAVVGHTEKMKEFVTKDEFNYKMNQLVNGQDKILKIVTRLDEERLFSSERISRLEEKINI